MTIGQVISGEKGWLVIHGGGAISEAIRLRFVSLAGGRNAHVILIPTAMSDADIAKHGFLQGQGRGWAESWGINFVTMLHTRDKALANSDYFAGALRNASGVWMLGGRQSRLAEAYLDTAVECEIKELLARGGIVGGSSAGASIQASFLVRADPGNAENPNGDNTIVISPGHTRGFGLLTNSAIDQHWDTQKREKGLLEVIERYPELLGLGIHEGAAIVVHGDSFQVIGGKVAVYDGQRHNGDLYYFLSTGQTFDLRQRHVQ